MSRPLQLVLVAVIAAAVTGGCVSRELHITSEPEGAEVLINDTYAGTTPMTHEFVHYQTFLIRLRKEGYQPIIVEERITAPAYQQPGVDFVSEALVPAHIEDRRELHYTLQKVGELDPREDVLGRAKARREDLAEAVREREAEEEETEHITLPLPVKERVKEAEEEEARRSPEEAADEASEDASGEVAPQSDGDAEEADSTP